MNVSVPGAVGALVLAFSLGLVAIPSRSRRSSRQGFYRVGFPYGPPVTPGARVFEDALRELGWTRGHNIAIEYRSAEGHLDRRLLSLPDSSLSEWI